MLWRLVVTFLLFTVIILLLVKSTYLGQDIIVFLICSRSVHVLFPYHLRFASGDTLFFLWLAWAEEGGILGSAIGVMFDLLLPFSKGWQTQKGHANFGTSFLLVCAWVSYRVSIQTQYILHTDSLFPGSFLRFLPIPSLL